MTRTISPAEMHQLPLARPAIVRYARYARQLAQLAADLLLARRGA